MAKKPKPKKQESARPNPGPNGSGRTWTVLVYMAAEDDLRLDNLAVNDLREMERGSRTNKDVNVIVQINRAWPGVPQRYHISKGTTSLLGSADHTNMGSEETLTEFLTWVDEKYPESRANPCLLVLWGHAFGLGFGRDHFDPLRLRELVGALRAFMQRRGKRLELLGTNACAMSYAEAAYELHECAKYLVASEIAVPFAGWPYETILKGIKRGISTPLLGNMIVDSYVNHFAIGRSDLQVSMTLLNLDEASKLGLKLKRLTIALHETLSPRVAAGNNGITLIRDVFRATAGGDVRPLIDLMDLCEGLNDLFKELSMGERVKKPYQGPNEAAEDLMTFLTPAVEQIGLDRTINRKKRDDRFFVEYHRRHVELQELHGVGIFAPFVTDEQDLKRLELLDRRIKDQRSGGNNSYAKSQTLNCGETEYKSLGLVKEALWAGLVYDDLHQEIAEDIWADVDGSGAANSVERSAITQMLISVDSTFNTFDRTVASVQEDIRQRLTESPSPSGGRALTSPLDRIKAVRLFGPPSLRLFQSSDLEAQIATDQQNIQKLSLKASVDAADGSSLSPETIPKVVEPCKRMEKALTELERATKRILTHAEFGLGPPQMKFGSLGPKPGGGFGPKPGGGFGPKPGGGFGPKPGGGFGPKPGGGFGPKPGGGFGTSVENLLENALGVLESADETPEAELARLFGQVGSIMSDLEQAAANVERTAATVLTDPRYGLGLSEEEVKKAATEVIGQAFSELDELATLARRTVRRVLANPVYGLGPGSHDFGRIDREEFAKFGGLSRLNLRLL